jgi:hypothetical protein
MHMRFAISLIGALLAWQANAASANFVKDGVSNAQERRDAKSCGMRDDNTIASGTLGKYRTCLIEKGYREVPVSQADAEK